MQLHRNAPCSAPGVNPPSSAWQASPAVSWGEWRTAAPTSARGFLMACAAGQPITQNTRSKERASPSETHRASPWRGPAHGAALS
eukprot:5293299-Alexandrium_andersonii.AAC.2